MPPVQTTSAELFQACETIFGPEVKVSIDFLEYLQLTGIKTAFRKRAFETHPDRAKALGSYAIDLNEQFINVRKAYERLLSFVETKNEGTVCSSLFNDLRNQQDNSYKSKDNYSFYNTQHKGGQKKGHSNQKNKSHPDHFYTGTVPKGNLLLGQFLYYSGLISWQTLINAICWQRGQRPLIGQIAVKWGLISYQDVLSILKIRTFNEKFGECALRTGYISSFELYALVGKQKNLQRPFGEYFTESGILSPSDLIYMAQKHQLHNLTVYKWKE
jgi:curved DNA-binding protein CbpA